MDEPHIIRLRGPWQRRIVDGASARQTQEQMREQTATIRMPSSWSEDLGADFVGVVCYERMFNRPTGIDDSTDIRLRLLEVVGKLSTVRLNGEILGRIQWPDATIELDLAGKLKRRNQLVIEIESLLDGDEESSRLKRQPDSASHELRSQGLVGEVHLEIR